MNEIDWAILVVLGLSTILGLVRGLVREVLAIVGWVAGVILAMRFSMDIAVVIPFESLSLGIRTVIAFVLIVAVVLFSFGMLGKLLSKALSAASITFEDRMLGGAFGLARGIVIVCVMVFLFGMTSAIRTELWKNSILIIPAEKIIDFSMPFMPQSIADVRANYLVR